ncbi:alpha/beta fold hydrolase [Streptomyces sp. NPDC002033]|uniref:thioesterase II family protein n=1 Tax=unclassified Streptomyces TaxID=2593676 RepID=UPI0033286851
MSNTEDNGLWVRRFHPSPDARVRLVCLPHAGGSASYYFPVSAALAPDVEVLAVQYPGRQDRRHEPCIDDIQELAEQVFAALTPWTDRPLALFGHSMGASVGFEVARLLEHRAGVVPAALFPSGRRAPSRHRDENVHAQGDQRLIQEIQRLSGTEARLLDDPEVLRMALPALRGDYKAAETYRYVPGPDLSCPVTAFVGDADPKALVDEAADWAAHTTGPFTLKVYGGGHFFLNDHSKAVVADIADGLRATAAV